MAKKYGVSVADVMKGAGITDPRKLIAGKTITVTNGGGSVSKTEQSKSTVTNTDKSQSSRKNGWSQPPPPPEPPKKPDGDKSKKLLDGTIKTAGAIKAAEEIKDSAPEVINEAEKTIENVAEKVVSESGKIINDVLDCPRKGSALKIDIIRPITEANGNVVKEFPAIAQAHGFNDLVDNYAGHATKTTINNGKLYQLEGFLNGVKGRFEWIIQEGKVTHRMFIKDGIVNGVAIKP